jgi:D-alanyl-D-alanine carboxypeptidase
VKEPLCDSDSEVENYLVTQRRVRQIPGLCVGIAKVGAPARTWSFGYANLEHLVPATADTVFKLGSVSKHIVAAGFLLLHEDGIIDLNDNIACYLRPIPPEWREITIMQLLTHTSGLQRDPAKQRYYKVGSLEATVLDPGNLCLKFAPGKSWEYSNLGYFLLGLLLETVTKQSLSVFFRERVFSKLGMNSTRTTLSYDIVMNRASSYFHYNGNRMNAGDLRQFRPSGAFVSTPKI